MVWLALAAFVAFDFVVPFAAGLVFNLDNTASIALVGLFVWLGMLGPAGLAAAATRRIGILSTIILGFAFTIELGYFAERDWWWVNPGAWPTRLALPTMGLHFNLLPLDATDPMAEESPIPALILTLVLAAVGFVVAALVPPVSYTHLRAHETLS